MDVLIGAFRNAAADNREVLFLVRAWRMGVDECGAARFQLAVAHDALFHFRLGDLHFSAFHTYAKQVAVMAPPIGRRR
ncbi:hypothetical protein [Sinorhizobium medicae]|uniref:hypothetical protein n=1 Tax=Sinorhizobium medicae TaxID=110321 RepID=UPI002B1BD8BD|nr:hypothetical protein [Sinorhizobium medicae]